MSDDTKTLTITLEDDLNKNAIEEIMRAIAMISGVQEVEEDWL